MPSPIAQHKSKGSKRSRPGANQSAAVAPPFPELKISPAVARKIRLALPSGIRARVDRVAAHLGLSGEKFIEKLLRAGVGSLEEDFMTRTRDLRALAATRARREANRRLYSRLVKRRQAKERS